MLKLELLNWPDAETRAKPIRTKVFIEEQEVPEAEEWGHGDDTALHIIATLNGQAVATARLTETGSIGRMAVLKPYRQQNIGSAMLQTLIKTAKQRGLKRLTLNAQLHAQPFYNKHNFVKQGSVFMDAGMPHIEMQLTLT